MEKINNMNLLKKIDECIEKRRINLENNNQENSHFSTELNILFLESIKKIIKNSDENKELECVIKNHELECVIKKILKQLYIYNVNVLKLIDIEVPTSNSDIDFIFENTRKEKEIFFIEFKISNNNLEAFISNINSIKKQFKKQYAGFKDYFEKNYKDKYNELSHLLFVYNEKLDLFYIRKNVDNK